jgi:hypothetical protein
MADKPKLNLRCDVPGKNPTKVNPVSSSTGLRSPRKMMSSLRISSPRAARVRSEADSRLPGSPRDRNTLMGLFRIDATNEMQVACLKPLEAVLSEERTSEEIASQPDLYSKFVMLRFLRGLKFQNVAESANLYRAMLVWRKENGIDEVSASFSISYTSYHVCSPEIEFDN